MKPSNSSPHHRVILTVALLISLLPGCLLIRTSEHRIKLNPDGSGEAVLRLVDIRSDGATDSAVVDDFNIMMSSFDKEGVKDFEQSGRKITEKRLYVSGDTLFAEIWYTFPSLTAVEGLNATKTELFVVVPEGREVFRTNGKTGEWERNSTRVVWDRDAKRVFYSIREKTLTPSVSLARFYQTRTR